MQYLRTTIGKSLELLPNRLFLHLFYYRAQGERLNLKNPLKYTEKIQWLKLNGNLERFAKYVDKYTVREYIEKKIGAKYLVPLLGVYDSYDQIPFDTLPNQFVLKGTHGCGYNFICRDKSAIDHKTLKITFDHWLREAFYKQEREMQYKPCTPRIVCEKYLEDESGGLCDYKFSCSNGEPKIVQFDIDRFGNHREAMLDISWKPSGVSAHFVGAVETPKKPDNLDEMLGLARKLSSDFPFVRVDLFSVGKKVYFGELTFTPGSGRVKFTPETADVELGQLIDINSYVAAS
jgi:hypothetical protein